MKLNKHLPYYKSLQPIISNAETISLKAEAEHLEYTSNFAWNLNNFHYNLFESLNKQFIWANFKKKNS